MKRTAIAAALAALFVTAASAQPGPMGPGSGMGPGMMGGCGPGYGMGPGMMGPGMMGGHGMGPGMMGPGMMGGHGMGPGMMGEFGPGYGMGPGMMGGRGYGAYGALSLSDEQRAKIAGIQRELSRKHWELMGKVHEERNRLFEQLEAGKADDQAERKAYQAMADAHKQMFESSLDARKRIDAVLTPEQREQWHRGARGGRGNR